jgi:hypothetical protein
LCAVRLQFRTQFDPASDILPEIQSQDFFHLQPVSTGTVSPFNLLDLELRVARLIGPFPGKCRENDATSWFGVLIFLDRLLQAAAPSARRVKRIFLRCGAQDWPAFRSVRIRPPTARATDS